MQFLIPNDGWTTGPAAVCGTTLGRSLHRLGDMLTARCVALASLRYGSSGHSNRVSHSETAYASHLDSGLASLYTYVTSVRSPLHVVMTVCIHNWYVTIRAWWDAHIIHIHPITILIHPAQERQHATVHIQRSLRNWRRMQRCLRYGS